MQIKSVLLLILFAGTALGLSAQQAEQEKQKNTQDKTPTEKKQNLPLSVQNGKRGSTFKPSEKVSPDVPVSFPADI